MPFCTTSWAVETALATLGLASNACGSVLGLLSIALTRTYLPPIWPITLAYSFSAPTATTWPPELVAAEVDEQAVAVTPAVTASATSTIPRRDSRESMVRLLQSRFSARRAGTTSLLQMKTITSMSTRGQAVRPMPGRRGTRDWREDRPRADAGPAGGGDGPPEGGDGPSASSPMAYWVLFAQEVPRWPRTRTVPRFRGSLTAVLPRR